MNFNVTHRILVKATENNHSYDLIAIDVNSGTYRAVNVKQQQTSIRVREKLYAETSSKTALELDEALNVAKQFNDKRQSLGFQPIAFERLEELKTESNK